MLLLSLVATSRLGSELRGFAGRLLSGGSGPTQNVARLKCSRVAWIPSLLWGKPGTAARATEWSQRLRRSARSKTRHLARRELPISEMREPVPRDRWLLCGRYKRTPDLQPKQNVGSAGQLIWSCASLCVTCHLLLPIWDKEFRYSERNDIELRIKNVIDLL